MLSSSPSLLLHDTTPLLLQHNNNMLASSITASSTNCLSSSTTPPTILSQSSSLPNNNLQQQNQALENAKSSLVSLLSAATSSDAQQCACKSSSNHDNDGSVNNYLNTLNSKNNNINLNSNNTISGGGSTTTKTTTSSITPPQQQQSLLSKNHQLAIKQSDHIYNLLNEQFDEIDIFEAIADIRDPEHPYSLEELNIVSENSVVMQNSSNLVQIYFTPTVKHCSLVSHISLCIRERLKNRYGKNTFKTRYKLEIYVSEGSHNEEEQVNKQMNDKERVTAALENPLIMELVRQCIGEVDY